MLDKIMQKLLESYDWNIRSVAQGDDDYTCGYADATGQCILDIGQLLGEKYAEPYKYEAYRRVMQFTTARQYLKDYPKPMNAYDDRQIK